jgi:predicted acyl esterase
VRTYTEPSGDSSTAPYVSGAAQPTTSDWTMTLGTPGQTATLRYDPASGGTSGQWFLRGSEPGMYPPFDSYLGIDGPADQRLEESTSVSLASPPLTKATTVTGEGVLRLRVVPSGTEQFIVARVVDEIPPGSAQFPGGYGTLVTNGWLLASHRFGDTAEQIKPLVPGQATTLTLPIWPVGYRFADGDRIQLDLYASDTPRFAPSTSPSEVTIDLGASQLRLPVVG